LRGRYLCPAAGRPANASYCRAQGREKHGILRQLPLRVMIIEPEHGKMKIATKYESGNRREQVALVAKLTIPVNLAKLPFG